MNIAIFASGAGSNTENIIHHFRGRSDVRVVLVLSNRTEAGVITKAQALGVPTAVLSRSAFSEQEALMGLLEKYRVEFIVLAGFLLVIPHFLIEAFPRRIVNIHPSLLPKYGGKGMWGHHVHEAVKAAGDSVTGITIHYVSDVVDGGEIIFQASTPIKPTDSPDDIATAVHALEAEHFPSVLDKLLTLQ